MIRFAMTNKNSELVGWWACKYTEYIGASLTFFVDRFFTHEQ
jgi:hypothetical protein